MNPPKIILMLGAGVAVFALIAGCSTSGPVTPAVTPTPTATSFPTTLMTPTSTTMPMTMTGMTKPETVPTTGAPGTTAPAPVPVTIDLVAKGFAFNSSLITVPAGAAVTIRFSNQDPGVPHNVAIYNSPAQTTNLFRGELITGVKTIEYRFTAPATREDYYFRCDPHAGMNGIFRVT
jgi:plastocyanin